MKKKLKDMDLLDNFLFGSVVTYPEIGEAFTRRLLRIILKREFGSLHVTAPIHGAHNEVQCCQ